MSVLFYLIACCVSVLNLSESARILAIFPTPSISHQVVFRPITQELAKRGHELVVLTTDPVFTNGKKLANLTEIDVHDISYKIWREKVMTMSTGNSDDFIMQLEVLLEATFLAVEAQLQDQQVKNLIRDREQKFDLILIEACARSALIYSHFFKAPVIQVSSFFAVFDNYPIIGAPSHLFLYPEISNTKTLNLNNWEKLQLLYFNYKMNSLWADIKKREQKMLVNNLGDNIPTLNELSNNVDMLFLNVHPIFQGIQPVPPSVIFMGGLHQNPEKDLPTDLKAYLDSSKRGVIYISFGTNVDPSLLPPEKIQTLVQVFSKLPYNVLWKWNKDELPGRTDNIKISKWLPQSDLLRHPNIKLFITQGGLQSTDEAITAGVPLIGIPMLGDQWYNVERYVHHKIGIRIDLDDLDQEKLTNAINTIVEDQSYRRNIVKLRNFMHDQPMRPLDRAIWWIEYVLRHGGAKHLRSPAANITWTEYLELELVSIVISILLVALIILALFIRSVYFLVKNNVIVKFKQA